MVAKTTELAAPTRMLMILTARKKTTKASVVARSGGERIRRKRGKKIKRWRRGGIRREEALMDEKTAPRK